MAEFERTQYKEENKKLKKKVHNKTIKDKEAIKKYEKTIELLKNEKEERIKKFENMDEEDVLKEFGIKKR